jgi:putative DNA methylase
VVESAGDGAVVPKRKLIEVALPLETINRESAREKSIRHGHPSTLHLWWARRPLAAARAVLFAQLVDDPSSHPERFPTEEAQRAERERLHALIERLVVWENTRDQELLAQAHQEILNSTGGNPPPILDPFAGGGTIPLEAQRLGLEAHASDLNPVAVLINKALIEIPPKFAGRPPVFPGVATEKMNWAGAEGLAADVRAYGEWMRDQAEKRIGQHYPKAKLPNGDEATVIAWIWARTVTCPNPACGIEMPLVRSWWLGKKKGKEAWVQPIIAPDPDHPSGKRVEFEIGYGTIGAPTKDADGTVNRNGATCIACGSSVELEYIRATSREVGLGAKLMAIVAEGNRRREYLPPNEQHRSAASVERPDTAPEASLPAEALGFRVQNYGLTHWADLFTNRQLLALTTFSDLVMEARECVVADTLTVGMPAGDRLESGGTGAEAYADAVATYLGLAMSRGTDRQSSICSWDASPSKEQVRGVFARQAIPMTWDLAEANPFAHSSGTWRESVDWVAKCIDRLEGGEQVSSARQLDAASVGMGGQLISTDPPYYDNIGYSDLSDFFYVWLRRSLRDVFPELLSTMLVPKADELVANPYRHDGKDGAREFFEDGFRRVFARAREAALPDYPITVYYAFKQSDSDADGTASTGWETLLDGMIHSGWAITATWPVRSEASNRMRSLDSNALTSSIVLALRPRPADAPTTDRRGLIAALQAELPEALRKLQQGVIAPVDLPQAAIGPGMAVFSRYARVIEDDGSAMSVRAALARINEILDQVLNEQEGDYDSPTRFAIAWYRQHGYARGDFGDADNLARARNTSVATLAREGILTSAAGEVTLLAPSALDPEYDVAADDHVSVWEVLQHLIRVLDGGGLPAAGALLRSVQERPADSVELDLVKDLAFLLFSIAERGGRVRDALAFNTVATSWPEILDQARAAQDSAPAQTALQFDEGTDG